MGEATLQNKVNIVNLLRCNLMHESGRDVPIHALWRDQKAIFVFLRHFACIGCRIHAKQIWEKRELYQKDGAKIYFIASGGVNHIEMFKEDHGIEDDVVYTDLTMDCFRAAGFRRGFLATYGPQSIKNLAKMVWDGNPLSLEKYKQNPGDLWQLGGLLAIARNGKVLYHYISHAIGDFPPEKDDAIIQEVHVLGETVEIKPAEAPAPVEELKSG